MIWIYQDGKIVPRDGARRAEPNRSLLPAPRVSRMETYESPVTGKDITSWRERDRDMHAADAVDPRDIPKKVFEKRKQIVERNVRSDDAA